MTSFKSNGIVIKEKNVGEADKSIVVAFKDYGKIPLYIKNGRKPKSQVLSGTQLFSYSEFVINERNGYMNASQIDSIENFYKISNDYEKLCYGHYFLELSDKILMEKMVNNDLILLLLRTLSALSKSIIDNKLIFSIFNFKILQISGFTPNTEICSSCKKELLSELYFTKEGLSCADCKSKSSFCKIISETTLYALKKILTSNINDLYSFTLESKYISELENISMLFVISHIDIEIKSLEFIKSFSKI